MEIPPNDGFVTDAAGLLSVEEDEALEAMLTQYRSQTSNEIAIVILQTVTGSSIAEVAVEIGKKWGVGSEKDNGILLLISYEDREMFLATGYGLEGAVPDIVSKGIIEEEIAPFFREAKYAEGLQAGIVALQKHIAGEYTADRYEGSSDTGGAMSWVFFFIFIFFNWIAASLARSKSWWAGGIAGAIFGLILVGLYGWWLSVPILAGLGFLFDYLFSTGKIGTGRRGGGSPWTGGFGGRGGGGGGFGGFGGGSFGGGGARGKW
jgi:uncharacterized protein